MNRYANKRMMHRTGGGQFRKAQGSDIGIMGVCPTCNHLLLRHYDGDPREAFPDPRKFRNRCFTCEPETEAEQALAAEIEASKPKMPTLMDIFAKAAEHPESVDAFNARVTREERQMAERQPLHPNGPH